jgi:hypothetical protein
VKNNSPSMSSIRWTSDHIDELIMLTNDMDVCVCVLYISRTSKFRFTIEQKSN